MDTFEKVRIHPGLDDFQRMLDLLNDAYKTSYELRNELEKQAKVIDDLREEVLYWVWKANER